MIIGQEHLKEPGRDRFGRPVVLGTARQRASTFAKVLDTPGGLPAWYGRQTALGLAGSPDLLAEVSTLKATDKTRLDQVVSAAMEKSDSFAGRRMGSALHSAADLIDQGESLDNLPESLVTGATVYKEAIRDLDPVASELFVYSERFDVAGSLDRLFVTPDEETIVGDLKTTTSPDSAKYNAVAWALQVAAYATGKPYCAEHGLMEWEDLGLEEPSLELATIIHYPQGQDYATRYDVDLGNALRAADIAVRVRSLRKYRFLTLS